MYPCCEGCGCLWLPSELDTAKRWIVMTWPMARGGGHHPSVGQLPSEQLVPSLRPSHNPSLPQSNNPSFPPSHNLSLPPPPLPHGE